MERVLPRLLNWRPLPWLSLIPLAFIAWSIFQNSNGGDAHAYWVSAGYGVVDERDAFLYTPPFLVALWPFQQLPWEPFRILMLTGQVAILVWLVGPVIALLVVLPGAYSPVYTDLWYGNVMILTGAVTVAGFRQPAWWALLPFGKILPGVALLWSWKPWPIVIGVTALSAVLAPLLWVEWWEAMQRSAGAGIGLTAWLIPRAVIAAGLVIVGRWRGWRWTVPLAVTLAQPVLWYSSFAILLGWVWLLRNRPAASATSPQTPRPQQ